MNLILNYFYFDICISKLRSNKCSHCRIQLKNLSDGTIKLLKVALTVLAYALKWINNLSALSSRSEQFTSSFMQVLHSCLRKSLFNINPKTYITALRKSRSLGFWKKMYVLQNLKYIILKRLTHRLSYLRWNV